MQAGSTGMKALLKKVGISSESTKASNSKAQDAGLRRFLLRQEETALGSWDQRFLLSTRARSLKGRMSSAGAWIIGKCGFLPA